MIKILAIKYHVTALCTYLEASTSTYYLYEKRNPQKYNYDLRNLIAKIYSRRVSAGYRTIQMILKRKYNITSNHKKIMCIMRNSGIKAKQYCRKYKFNKALQKSRIYDNILSRNFRCNKSNEKWSIDITYIPDKTKNTYLVCIKDLYDKRIVNFKSSTNMNEDFVLACVRESFEKNNVQNNKLILHSDQGIHSSTHAYIKLLNEYNVVGSRSRKGNYHENAPIESFFQF